MRGFSLLILLLSTNLFATVSLDGLAQSKAVLTSEVNISELKDYQLYIATPFAKPVILNPEQKKLLKERIVLKIELVYTQYRSSPSFNQAQLNLNRLKQLKDLVPQVFEFPLWDFQLTEQTNGNSPEECNKMFHGFIITFRPNSSNSTLQKEADYIEKLVVSMLKNDSTTNDSSSSTIKPQKFDIKTHYDKQWGYIHDTIWYIDTVKPPSPPDFFYNHALYKDSTVINVFDRNKDWNDFIVVTDVTGSMSPYSAQVFVWLKAQAENKKAKYFVFFNDGDDMESRKKKPLETKGVYVAENIGIDNITDVAAKCMRNGSGGGENRENDIEAIIEGLKYYGGANSIVLIADNFESMRDYDYIERIKKPVHVVLCGAENRINVQYLDLAYRTNGSVHTKYSDVNNLNETKDGQHVYIDEKKYLFKNKRFHSVYESFDYQNTSARKAAIKIGSK